MSSRLFQFLGILFVGVAAVGISSAAAMQKQVMPLSSGWEFHQLVSGPTVESANSVIQDASQWHPAVVPGSVHLDLLHNNLIPDPYYRDNEAKLQWIEDADWEYRTTIQAPPDLLARKNIDLVFEGLDAYAEVYLNDKLILTADNMFREWRVPVKSLLKPGANQLHIVFPSPIKAAAKIAATDKWREQDPRRRENLPPQSRLRIWLGLGTSLRHQRHLAPCSPGSLGRRAHFQPSHRQLDVTAKVAHLSAKSKSPPPKTPPPKSLSTSPTPARKWNSHAP